MNIKKFFGEIFRKKHQKEQTYPIVENFKDIPIFIISYNRLDYLSCLVKRLEDMNYTNIHIVDNNSNYEPLIEYLKASKHHVHLLDKNYGHKVVWECDEIKELLKDTFYAVSDSDIEPLGECPDDFMEKFYNILIANKKYTKVGFSLKIDDIPECYSEKKYVEYWEHQFYEKKLKTNDMVCFKANIDTTFALYRPYTDEFDTEVDDFFTAIRTPYPYQARHLPWYSDSNSKSDNEKFYIQTANPNITTWSEHIDHNTFVKTKFQPHKVINILGIKIKIKVDKL